MPELHVAAKFGLPQPNSCSTTHTSQYHSFKWNDTTLYELGKHKHSNLPISTNSLTICQFEWLEHMSNTRVDVIFLPYQKVYVSGCFRQLHWHGATHKILKRQLLFLEMFSNHVSWLNLRKILQMILCMFLHCRFLANPKRLHQKWIDLGMPNRIW